MGKFVKKAITKFNTYTNSTSKIHDRSQSIQSALGKKAYTFTAWVLSGLLLPLLVAMLVVAFLAFFKGSVTWADVMTFKDFIGGMGHIFLANTWLLGVGLVLYLLKMWLDNWAFGLAGSIWNLLFKT